MERAVVRRLAEEVNRLVAARRDLGRELRDWPCSLPDLTLLGALDRHGLQRVTELAADLGVDASVVSRQVSRLVAAGWVERTTDPDDGRSHPLRVTEAGTRLLDDSRDQVIDRWDAALAGWSEHELATLTHAIHRLHADLTGGSLGGTVPTRHTEPQKAAIA